ncbi:MAG TPA: hypothetical protein VKJ47_02795 [Candidatus Binatia bacterium]|nr:hypothetical protein [Candidatus Binatia bacterium]
MKGFLRTCLRRWGLAGLCYGLCCAGGGVIARAEEITLRGIMPAEVQEIEIVYVEGRDPQVSWKRVVPPPRRPALRPSGPVVDLLASAGEVHSFGECTHAEERAGGRLVITTQAERDGPCGHVLSLRPQGVPLDALSYGVLHVSGTASVGATISVADEAARRREDSVPLAQVSGRFDLRVPLGPAARRLDLRRLISLVLLPAGQANSLVLETLALEESPSPRRNAAGLGFWVWEYREAISRGDELLDACQRFGCTRLMVQLPAAADTDELWHAYVRFLDAARERGITPFVLDGAPEAIRSPAALIGKLRRLRTLFADERLPGVQLDVEPYLLEDFFLDPENGFTQYLAVIDRVKELLAGRAPLSIVMPFWFTSQMVKDRPVAFAVMDRADEVAVMSYRTDVRELHEIAEDTLRYGEMAGVPVWLAVETRPLPLERHVLLRRESRRELADAYLDRAGGRLVLQAPPSADGIEWFHVDQRSTVRPERLTFAGRDRKAVRTAVAAVMGAASRYPHLAGVLIHDLQGFTALPE